MTRCVTLQDGTVVSSSSEAWRAECEALTVCQMATQAARREYLAAVEKHRGRPSRERLEEAARAMWAAADRSKATPTAR